MLPELEQLERVGLFNALEIRQIINKRRVFEYKLRRKKKVKEDYLKYIQYEINVLALVKLRRKKTGYNFKKLEIDASILHRIHKLFILALSRFSDDVSLWTSYIAFAKQRKDKATVSRQYTKMLQVHDKKADLWISAAKWEFEENNNSDNARSLLQRGLRFNNTSKTLWLEYYRLELLIAEKMRQRKQILGGEAGSEHESSDPVLKGQLSYIVFTQATQTILGDVNFVISFLQICQLFDFTKEQEDSICDELKQNFSDKAAAWDALAKRRLGRVKNKVTDYCVEEMEFHQIYEEAVKSVHTDEIWSNYIASCLELLERAKKKTLISKRIQRVLIVFEMAKDEGHLSAQLWGKWIDLLEKTGHAKKALEMSKASVLSHPNKAALWQKTVALMIVFDASIKEVEQTLATAQKSVPQKESWPVIELVLNHAMNVDAADTVVRILEKCMISNVHDVRFPAHEFYIQYEYLKHGIEKARKIYERICQYRPVSLKFYKSYITMELSQCVVKMAKIRKVYEEATREYGSSEPDLWLDYIKLETSNSNGNPLNVGMLYFRAIKSLDGAANYEFIRKHTLWQTC